MCYVWYTILSCTSFSIPQKMCISRPYCSKIGWIPNRDHPLLFKRNSDASKNYSKGTTVDDDILKYHLQSLVSWKLQSKVSSHKEFSAKLYIPSTLVYRIDVQYKINLQVGKFLKNIKRAGQNRCAGGIFFSKLSINVQGEINVQGGFHFKTLILCIN